MTHLGICLTYRSWTFRAIFLPIRSRRPWFILGAQTVDDAGSRSALCQNVRELCDSHLMPADRVIVKAHAYNEKKSWFKASRH